MLADIYSQFKEHTTPKFRRGILITGVLTVAIVVAIGSIYQKHLDVVESENEAQERVQEVWNKTEEKVRATSSLDINFSKIDTSRSIYRELEQAAYDTINYTRLNSEEQTPAVESSLQVEDGEQYIVSNESGDESSSTNAEDMRLVSGIYCRDMYVAQYMNRDGQFDTVISTYQDNSVTAKYRADYKVADVKHQINLEDTVEQHKRDPIYIISEDEYLSDIGYVIGNIYSKAGKSLEELKPITDIYFTDCIKKLWDDIEDRDIIDSTVVSLIEPGYSSLDTEMIDRVYVQLELNIGSKAAYVDLELKLGSNREVYDIDVL